MEILFGNIALLLFFTLLIYLIGACQTNLESTDHFAELIRLVGEHSVKEKIIKSKAQNIKRQAKDQRSVLPNRHTNSLKGLRVEFDNSHSQVADDCCKLIGCCIRTG